MSEGLPSPQRIKAKVSLRSILEQRGYRLDTGRPTQIACPFHDDQTPSARYYPASDDVTCFTCNRQFDVLDFFRLFESQSRGRDLSAYETLKLMAEKYGVQSVGSVEESIDRLKALLARKPTTDKRLQREIRFVEAYQQFPNWWDREEVFKILDLIDTGSELSEDYLNEVLKMLAEQHGG